MSEHQKTHQSAQQAKSGKVTKPEVNPRQKLDPQQIMDAPETLRPEDVLNAQQVLGNQVVQRALDKNPRREDSTDEQGNLLPEISDQINEARGGGNPLPSDIQNEARQTLGSSFKDVRLHTGEEADAISRRISARAFTIGKDIFFKKDAYAPGTTQGRETLIHELTHVKQQSGSRTGGKLKLGERGSAMEQQADQMGKQAARGIGKAASQVQRMPFEEDELQMQAEEEEELQMQADEEEELQMQPDLIVQRDGDDDDWDTGDDTKEEPEMITPEKMQSLGGQLVKQLSKKPSTEQEPEVEPSSKVEQEGPDQDEDKDDEERFSMSPKNRLKKLFDDRDKREKEQAEKKPNEVKQKWMNTLRDPKASKEDIEKAQKRLKVLHKGSSKQFAQAQKERQTALENAAKEGDEEAFKKLEDEKGAEKEKKFSGLKKFGGFMAKIGKGIGGVVADQGKDGLKHFLGVDPDKDDDDDEDDEKDKKDKKSKKKGGKDKGKPDGDSGGGGSAAIGTIMEKYAQVVEENNKLKAQLEKKEAA
jgi:hypothetical protein